MVLIKYSSELAIIVCVKLKITSPNPNPSAHLLQVEVISQLHVLGVDAQDLQAADGVWDADVNLIFYK